MNELKASSGVQPWLEGDNPENSNILPKDSPYWSNLRGWLAEYGQTSMPSLFYSYTNRGSPTDVKGDWSSFCEDKKYTLHIIKCTNGYIFGGYTDVRIGMPRKSTGTFCFSLVNPYKTDPVKLVYTNYTLPFTTGKGNALIFAGEIKVFATNDKNTAHCTRLTADPPIDIDVIVFSCRLRLRA